MFPWKAEVDANERPAGLLAIAAALAISAMFSISFALLHVFGLVPLSFGAFLLGGGLEQLGSVAFLANALIAGLLCLGLWYRWRGFRRLAVVYLLAGVALAVPAISSAVVDARGIAIAREGLQIIIRVAAIYYLSQEPVKEWYGPRGMP